VLSPPTEKGQGSAELNKRPKQLLQDDLVFNKTLTCQIDCSYVTFPKKKSAMYTGVRQQGVSSDPPAPVQSGHVSKDYRSHRKRASKINPFSEMRGIRHLDVTLGQRADKGGRQTASPSLVCTVIQRLPNVILSSSKTRGKNTNNEHVASKWCHRGEQVITGGKPRIFSPR